jgi:proline iminopeptidase
VGAVANDYFWPQIEPYERGALAVSDIHTLYWEQVGNPEGVPVLFLHGGPGAGSTAADRRFFDPSHFRVILFDQRGCGRSAPLGDLTDNTIDHLVADIEALRSELCIDTWHVFGGSWGSTLSLYYAQQHPSAVLSLVLRGIWLLRDEDLEWWLYTTRFVQPELWDEFASYIPVEERHDLLGAYRKRLGSADPDVVLEAAQHWSRYEGACCTLEPNPEFASHFDDPDVARSMALLEAEYFANGQFEPEDLLLRRVDAIRSIPAFVVHGRYDIVCPVKNAHDLRAAWPEASYVIVPDAGHSSHEPGITEQLVSAMNRIRDLGSPAL